MRAWRVGLLCLALSRVAGFQPGLSPQLRGRAARTAKPAMALDQFISLLAADTILLPNADTAAAAASAAAPEADPGWFDG